MDAEGNLYVAAAIWKPQPPASLTTVVAKVDRNLKKVYQYTFSQPGESFPTAITVDRQGNVFVAGWADAAGFPLVNPISSTWHAPVSGYISKLDPSGSTLLFSTYLGETVTGLALDAPGNLYATGYAPPNDIPVTPGSFRAPAPSGTAATVTFIVKLSNSGDRLIYAATLGSAYPGGIAVSPDGSATIAGSTSDASYPTTSGAFQPVCGCAGQRLAGNGIVSRIGADGSSLVWSTFLGGHAGIGDQLQFVALAPDGGVIVAGTATSADFPVTPGSFQSGHATGDLDLVIAKFNSSASRLVYSSRFGSSRDQQVTALQVDPQGRAWIAGSTNRSDFPILPGTPALGNSVVAELETDGSKLVRTQLLPDGVAVRLLLDANGTENLFGEDASLLRIGPEGISAVSVMAFGNSAPQEVLGYVVSGSVAPGEIVSLYGVGLGPQAGAGAEFDSTGKISAKLAETQVFFDGIAAPLLYAGANQVNAVVPFAAGDRATTTVTVQTPAGSSSSTVLKIVAADPALPGVFDTYFGAYISVVLNQDGSLNSLANRAAPGDIVTFWVNGAGRFQQPLEDGAIVGTERAAPLLPVSVLLYQAKALPAEVLYAGTAPGIVAGIMQVNFRIPASATTGSYSAIELHLGDYIVYGSVAIP